MLLLCIVVLLLVIFTTKNCAVHSHESTLIVAIDSGQTHYAELGDSSFGFQYEIAKAFADSTGMTLQIISENDLKRNIENLLDKQCDIVASLIPITTEWIDHVAFTVPLLTTRQVLVQRIDTAVNLRQLQYELALDTIFLPANSPQKQRIANLSDEIADTIFIEEIVGASTEQMVQGVADGRYKNTICNERLAHKLKQNFPNLNISMPIGFDQSYCWVVRDDVPEFLEKLNKFLENFIKSEKYKEIYKKYFQ
jgi:membrane-bound lytic murein transglycosylase F